MRNHAGADFYISLGMQLAIWVKVRVLPSGAIFWQGMYFCRERA
jgi:hypothetical protein